MPRRKWRFNVDPHRVTSQTQQLGVVLARAEGGRKQYSNAEGAKVSGAEAELAYLLTPDDKLEIANALDEAGVDRIEAGFARVSEDDAEAIRRIASAGLRAEVWGFARAVQAVVHR